MRQGKTASKHRPASISASRSRTHCADNTEPDGLASGSSASNSISRPSVISPRRCQSATLHAWYGPAGSLDRSASGVNSCTKPVSERTRGPDHGSPGASPPFSSRIRRIISSAGGKGSSTRPTLCRCSTLRSLSCRSSATIRRAQDPHMGRRSGMPLTGRNHSNGSPHTGWLGCRWVLWHEAANPGQQHRTGLASSQSMAVDRSFRALRWTCFARSRGNWLRELSPSVSLSHGGRLHRSKA